MQNWIVFNRTVYLYETDLASSNLKCWYAIKPKLTSKYEQP